ncbi:MAG: serine hydrolase domain-containing protein [Acidimicrobiia bacterium]
MDIGSLSGWLDERATNGEFSGVALVWKNGDPLFEHAAGMAHRGLGVPVQTDSRFQVASVTKMVTAVAALQLVESGLLGLETPITDVLDQDLGAVTPAHIRRHDSSVAASGTGAKGGHHEGDSDQERSDLVGRCGRWDRPEWQAAPQVALRVRHEARGGASTC